MRRRTAKKHIILPDPKFKDTEVTKFVNSLMVDGKKNIAFNIFYDSIAIISEKNFRRWFRDMEKSSSKYYASCRS